jgi:hypothetical protein
MARVYVSAVMDIPIGEAWAVLRDFNALPVYNDKLFSKSMIEGGKPSDQIGCVRDFYTHEGGRIREELLTLSDRDYTCCYKILEASLPVRNYVAEMRLLPITEGNKTFGDWWAEYEVDEKDAAAVFEAVNNTFRFAFEGAVKVANGKRKK